MKVFHQDLPSNSKYTPLQDECHQIRNTFEVHIYRLVYERTIEENIINKTNQKCALDDLVIQISGSYTTQYFKKLDPIELRKKEE